MANVSRNKFARGSRGVFGEQFVVHQTGSGKTIIARKPVFDDNLTYTERQTMHAAAIRDSGIYASFEINQEAYIQKAEELGTTSYALAIADWYSAPRVLQIDIDKWTGNTGETIRVKARENVILAFVLVVIRDDSGQIFETGEALQSGVGSGWWNYTTQSFVPLTPFPQIQAIAFDLPGNRASFVIS